MACLAMLLLLLLAVVVQLPSDSQQVRSAVSCIHPVTFLPAPSDVADDTARCYGDDWPRKFIGSAVGQHVPLQKTPPPASDAAGGGVFGVDISNAEE